MAETANNPLPVEDEDQFQEETLSERFMDWVRTELVWYAGSFSFHLLAAFGPVACCRTLATSDNQGDAPVLESKADEVGQEGAREIRQGRYRRNRRQRRQRSWMSTPRWKSPPRRPRRRNITTTARSSSTRAAARRTARRTPASAAAGRWPSAPVPSWPARRASAWGWARARTTAAAAPAAVSAGAAAAAARPCWPRGGGTKHTERAVTAALVWLANHQVYDGSWSLQNFHAALHRQDLHGHGRSVRPMPAPRRWACCPSSPPGKRTSPKALTRTISSRASTGSSAISSPTATWPRAAAQMMYSHGLATIALCEAYGLTGDKQVGMRPRGR